MPKALQVPSLYFIISAQHCCCWTHEGIRFKRAPPANLLFWLALRHTKCSRSGPRNCDPFCEVVGDVSASRKSTRKNGAEEACGPGDLNWETRWHALINENLTMKHRKPHIRAGILRSTLVLVRHSLLTDILCTQTCGAHGSVCTCLRAVQIRRPTAVP